MIRQAGVIEQERQNRKKQKQKKKTKRGIKDPKNDLLTDATR